MAKLIYGVGYNSQRKHKATDNGRITKAYSAWYDMIRRCYCPVLKKKIPTYDGCSVDARWHDFQDFADWFYNHPHSSLRHHLDKDIINPKNNIYSPDTCCLVPRELNNLLLDHARGRGDYPQGVSFHKPLRKYRSQVAISGKTVHLGYFDTPEKAYQVYKTAKERYVKNKALEWANRIEWNVFVALMNWSLPNV